MIRHTLTHLLGSLRAALRRRRAVRSYRTLRFLLDGHDVMDIDRLLRRYGLERLSEPRSEDEMYANPRTDIERLTCGIPFGNTSSDEAFTVQNKDYQFLLLIHYGQVYTGRNYIDLTTQSLQTCD